MSCLHPVRNETDPSQQAQRFAALTAPKRKGTLAAAARRRSLSLGVLLVLSALTELAVFSIAAQAEAQLVYTTLNYGVTGTFLTGIRGNNIVRNYDTRLATGNAFIYKISTGTYTTNNFPDAVSTTAYGGSGGTRSPVGILHLGWGELG